MAPHSVDVAGARRAADQAIATAQRANEKADRIREHVDARDDIIARQISALSDNVSTLTRSIEPVVRATKWLQTKIAMAIIGAVLAAIGIGSKSAGDTSEQSREQTAEIIRQQTVGQHEREERMLAAVLARNDDRWQRRLDDERAALERRLARIESGNDRRNPDVGIMRANSRLSATQN